MTARHNEARDLNCDLCTLAGLAQGTSESILQESIGDGLESWSIGQQEDSGNTRELRCLISAF